MFDQLIEAHGRRLFGLCLKLCGDEPDAQDLYQETWLRAYRGYARYHPDRPFEPWLAHICVNLYRDGLRRRDARPLYDGFATAQEKDRALESVPAPERPPELDAVRAAVEGLPEKLRLAVILYYFTGLDVAETAAALGVPGGTVKSRLSKARNLLKERLRDDQLF